MNRIGELRRAKGITMKEAAQRLGLPYTTYVNYEKGIREPNSETLIALADFYQVSVDYLIGRNDPVGTVEGQIDFGNHLLKTLAAQYGGPQDTDGLVASILSLSDEDRNALLTASIGILSAIQLGKATVIDDDKKPITPSTGGSQAAPAPQKGKDTTPSQEDE